MRQLFGLVALSTMLLIISVPVWAQGAEPTSEPPQLVLFTSYPSQSVGMDETVSISLKLRAIGAAQVVRLEMKELPEGWTATFRGGATDIQSVYVEPENEASITLRLEPPANVAGNTYRFVVLARGDRSRAEFPIELTVKEKLPSRLSLKTDLPTLRASPTTTFRYTATLKNEGDDDLTVNLGAEAPTGFQVSVKTGGNEVTSLPLEAHQSKTLSIEARPYRELPADQYPITVWARGGEVEASLQLIAEIVGQPELTITAPDGRLSGRAYAGRENPLKLIIRNSGTAPTRGVKLSSSEPSGWSVEFDPNRIDEIPANQQVEVTAKIRPADKAVAGDYMLTVRAQAEEGVNKSAEFRITVLTSTLWGVVGVALVAVAVGVVALAVSRFGRR